MFQPVKRDHRFGLAAGAVLAAAIGLLAAPPVADAQAPDTRRLKREIRMMENVFDHVVVESRNVLVQSKSSVNGVYLPGFGALFTVEANLLLDHHGFRGWRWIHWDDDDDGWIVRRSRDDDDDDDDRRRDRSSRTEERLYEDAKGELADALIDYGDTLEELNPSDWIAVCMVLDESARIGDKRITRLVIKGKASDLRDYAAKRLTHDAAKARLVIEEY